MFLWILGVLNLVVLLGVIKVFRAMRHGVYDERALDGQLNKRGLMNRFLGGLTRWVRRPWHIYPVGVLFGLGFDTASEVALLVLAGIVLLFLAAWLVAIAVWRFGRIEQRWTVSPHHRAGPPT